MIDNLDVASAICSYCSAPAGQRGLWSVSEHWAASRLHPSDLAVLSSQRTRAVTSASQCPRTRTHSVTLPLVCRLNSDYLSIVACHAGILCISFSQRVRYNGDAVRPN